MFITVVPNGVDEGHFPSPLSREEAKRRLGLEGRMVIGFIGFVRAWHRAERLIDFLASPDGAAPCHVLLVGDGPSKEDLIQYAQQRGVADRFVVTGVVARDEIPAYLAAFDIAVLPDVVPYACPLKLIEYMAAGRAILAPDRPNIREHVAPGISAALFDIEQEGSFQAALARLAHDEGERDRLARSARETFTSRAMLWDDHARSVLRIIADQHTRQG